MRILFVKERMAFPRSSGHDVHCFHLMQALGRLGHAVSLATVAEVDARAIEGAELVSMHRLNDNIIEAEPLNLTKSQERFRNYWGISPERIHSVGRIADEVDAEAVVVVGLNVLPYLGAVTNAQRIWYAGDEWVWHHLSQTRMLRPGTWGNIKQALVKGLYERAYAGMLDRVWMVSNADAKAFRWVTGHRQVDVISNGIDADHFVPSDTTEVPHSCTFWGRLDFGPNVQALEWFCSKVWPRVRRTVPDAAFRIYGFQPTNEVRQLVKPEMGIRLTPDLPDLRAEIGKAELVVLPFVSGGGIKNKLLEAAALGKAIVCTPRTIEGLDAVDAVVSASRPRRFANELVALWNDRDRRRALGSAARTWVTTQQTWEAAARKAEEGLMQATVEVLPT